MRYLLSCCLLLLYCSSIGQVLFPVNIKYLHHQSAGIVTVQATAFGNKNKAKIIAQKRALEVLLFEGLPAAPVSNLRYPMIRDRKYAEENHASYFNNFFEKGYYNSYIRSVSEPKKQKVKARKKQKGITLIMTISYEQLLRDLRRQGIVKKMGF